MSAKIYKSPAHIFAALGDRTRLQLVTKLAEGEPQSISQLAARSILTRQAVTKHLRVLEGAGIVSSRRFGRESLFALDPQPLAEIRLFLGIVEEQWEQALGRLKDFVED